MIFKWSDLAYARMWGGNLEECLIDGLDCWIEPQGVLSSTSESKTTISSLEMRRHWERLQGAKSHSGGISTEATEHRFRRRSVPNRCRTLIYFILYFFFFLFSSFWFFFNFFVYLTCLCNCFQYISVFVCFNRKNDTPLPLWWGSVFFKCSWHFRRLKISPSVALLDFKWTKCPPFLFKATGGHRKRQRKEISVCSWTAIRKMGSIGC